MIHLGLVGYPLEHSLSPKIHTAAMKACALDGDYSLFPIHPDDKQGLQDLLARVRSGEINGLNVTIPHKQNVIEHMDQLTPTATAIGAVNTMYMRGLKLVGDNTDAPGFLLDLKRLLTTAPSEGDTAQRHGVLSALILGAGGSARAVVYALVHDGWKVTISARRPEQTQALVSSFPNHKIQITEYGFSNIDLSNISLIVNTTPLGMYPDIDQSPLPQNVTLPNNILIYDLVYNPRETKLVRQAHSQGRKATTGLGMLIEQAALAFELWTGHTPARDILWNAVEY